MDWQEVNNKFLPRCQCSVTASLRYVDPETRSELWHSNLLTACVTGRCVRGQQFSNFRRHGFDQATVERQFTVSLKLTA